MGNIFSSGGVVSRSRFMPIFIVVPFCEKSIETRVNGQFLN